MAQQRCNYGHEFDAEKSENICSYRGTDIQKIRREEEAAAEAKKKKTAKLFKLAIPAVCVIISAALAITAVMPTMQYDSAMNAGEYEEEAAVFEELNGHPNSKAAAAKPHIRKLCAAPVFSYGRSTPKDIIASGKLGNYEDTDEQSVERRKEAMVPEVLSTEGFHAVALKTDGTVVAVGSNDYGQCDVGGWTDIRLPE